MSPDAEKWQVGQAFSPEMPDATHEEAFEGAEDFTRALAVIAASSQVGASVGGVACLGKHDAMQDRVQPTVPTTIQSVTNGTG